MLNDIAYNSEPSLAVGEFVGVLRRSTLGERRPVDDVETVAAMLTHADLVVTARAGLHTALILLAAPMAQSYYPYIGMKRHDSCWFIERQA
jgi:hypothetical protein